MHLKGSNILEEFPCFSLTTSVLKLLLEAMDRNANKVALIEGDTGNTCRFGDILEQSKSISVGLRQRGVSPGEYVGICCKKSPLAFALELGVMFAGAIPILVDESSIAEISKNNSQYVTKAIFYDEDYLQSVNQLIPQMSPKPLFVSPINTNNSTVKSLLAPTNNFKLYEVEDIRKKVVLVLFTSGTTSVPKGVQISDLGLQRLGYSLADEDVSSYLLPSAFFWVSCTISLVSSVLKGYSLVLSETKDPASHFKLIETYKINGLTLPAASMNFYIKEPTRNSRDLSSLTTIHIGGGVAKRRTIQMFNSEVLKGKARVQVLYGMTEIGLLTTWKNKGLADPAKVDSSGYLAPEVEVMITDEEGQLAGPGNVGEIRTKSLSTMIGYWGRPELNESLFDSNGFFKTGDVGYFDNDGFLYICGRTSELVAHGNSKVSVSEMEELLRSHTAVLDAGVVAKFMPDAQLYNLIALVVVKPSILVTSAVISEFVLEETNGSVKLDAIHFVDKIPHTNSAKVHRGMLHNMVENLTIQ